MPRFVRGGGVITTVPQESSQGENAVQISHKQYELINNKSLSNRDEFGEEKYVCGFRKPRSESPVFKYSKKYISTTFKYFFYLLG